MRAGCIVTPIVILAILGFGAVVLMMWDIPAPSKVIERTLPDDRFPR